MARVEFLPDVFEDLQRIADHLERYDAGHVQARLGEVISAFDVLIDNPLIGRPTGENQSGLVIGRGSRGYVALYRYVPLIDTVFVLAIRAQRESGYAQDE